MSRTATASRHARVEQARAPALPRKPIPVLLLLTRAYVDRWDGRGPHGSLAFGEGVDRDGAMADLCRRLDQAEPQTFAGVVARRPPGHAGVMDPTAGYFATWGPLDNPIREGEAPSAIGVTLAPDARPMPQGIAYGVGHVPSSGGPVSTWRITLGNAEVPGRFGCDRRRFVSLEEFEEREAIREIG